MQISNELFKPINRKFKKEFEAVRPSLTYWQDVRRRLKSNKVAMISLVAIVFIFLIAIFGPLFSQYSYSDQVRGQESLWPNIHHIFGTDSLGRDMFVRICIGARISLSIGVVACIISLSIGTLYGGISGFIGGKVDMVLMRIIDIIYSVPLMLYVILLMVVLKGKLDEAFNSPFLSLFKTAGAGLISLYLVLGLIYWIPMARIVRGQVLSLKEQEFVTAARTIGASKTRILLRHLLPNCIGPIIVTTMLLIPEAIFTEAFLSFIGLGVDAPMASLGSLASDGTANIRSYFYLLASPALAISLTILTFNLFGDGLRDAMDPRMRK